jgi:formylglycine-generating enzyme required for sulfatase activity
MFALCHHRAVIAVALALSAVAGELVAERVDVARDDGVLTAPPGTGDDSSARAGMVLIPAGDYAPLIRSKDEPERIAVPAFWLDARQVTNGEFLEFVQAHPQWRRSAVSPLFADTGYLADWVGDLELGPRAPVNAPVVRVSWFAARAFARVQGKRLPTTAEWERAAAAGFSTVNGASEPGFTAHILAWFTKPTPATLPEAGAGRANYFGVRDLFGLVWEWVDDFNTAMVTGESRADTGLERDLFCGSGAAGARDPSDYAGFMRAGYRSSLRANYAVPNLGFRCAADSVSESRSNAGETPAVPGNASRL